MNMIKKGIEMNATERCPVGGVEGNEMDIKKVTQTHRGQYKPYGDSFYVWEIETDETDKAKVLEFCFNNLHNRVIPESAEWHRRISYGNDKWNDCGYYFSGYYTLKANENGYIFTVCKPFTD